MIAQRKTLLCFLATAAVGCGVLALLHDSVLRRRVDCFADIHLVFGAVLMIFVVAQFYCTMPSTAGSSLSEPSAVYRQLNRVMYLLLYSIVGIRQSIGLLDFYAYGDAFDFAFAGSGPPDNARFLGFDTQNDGHLFIVSAVLALCMIRLLMVGVCHRWARRDCGAAINKRGYAVVDRPRCSAFESTAIPASVNTCSSTAR